jgi:hypothetical protein
MSCFSPSLTRICLLLALPGAVAAQELALFEPVDVAPTAPASAQFLPQPAEAGFAAQAQALVLTGTSRIGERFVATLRDANGRSVQVHWRAGEASAIAQLPGYQLLQVSARAVRLALPPGMPCQAAPAQGIRCDSDGTVQLSLTTGAPLAPAQPPTDTLASATTGAAPVADAPTDAENPEIAADNPFAAALRAAAEEQRAGGRRGPFNVERFQPRRISPDQVPPGMRLVRTPFGDRLVEL